MRIAVVVAVTVSVVVSFHDVTVFVSFQEVTVSNWVTKMMPEDGVTGMTVNKPAPSFVRPGVVASDGAASTVWVVCGSAVVW
jgi:hypothetical protein